MLLVLPDMWTGKEYYAKHYFSEHNYRKQILRLGLLKCVCLDKYIIFERCICYSLLMLLVDTWTGKEYYAKYDFTLNTIIVNLTF